MAENCQKLKEDFEEIEGIQAESSRSEDFYDSIS